MLRRDGVQVHPVHRQRQQPGLLRVRRAAGRDDRVQHRRRVQLTHVGCGLGLVERGAGHTTNLERTTDTFRADSGENPVIYKGKPSPRHRPIGCSACLDTYLFRVGQAAPALGLSEAFALSTTPAAPDLRQVSDELAATWPNRSPIAARLEVATAGNTAPAVWTGPRPESRRCFADTTWAPAGGPSLLAPCRDAVAARPSPRRALVPRPDRATSAGRWSSRAADGPRSAAGSAGCPRRCRGSWSPAPTSPAARARCSRRCRPAPRNAG
jgi:hypothetical protein